MKKVIVFSWLLYACSSPFTDPKNELNTGYRLMQAGDPDKSYDHLLLAYYNADGGTKGMAALYLASLMKSAGKYRQSLEYGREAIALLKGNDRFLAAAMKNQAKTLGITGNTGEAEYFYREAIRRYATGRLKSRALRSMAVMYTDHNRPQKALAALRQCLTYGYDSGYIYNNMGYAFLSTDAKDSAEVYLLKALDYKETDRESTYGNLAQVYYGVNDSLSAYYTYLASPSDYVEFSLAKMRASSPGRMSKDSLLQMQAKSIAYYEQKERQAKTMENKALHYKVETVNLIRNDYYKKIYQFTALLVLAVIIIGVSGYFLLKYYRINVGLMSLIKKYFPHEI